MTLTQDVFWAMFEPIRTLPNYTLSQYIITKWGIQWPDMTSKSLDEWFWAVPEPTSKAWPSLILDHISCELEK